MSTIDKCIEIAKDVNAESVLDRAEALKASAEDKTYMLSFMGQFSAGKSRLINCLLKRNILPVHITETTATVTFIRYGESETARLKLINGTVRDIELDDVRELWQSGNMPHQINLCDVESIDVYINSELLRNGLVIADTPGINTLLSRHEKLTLELISNTDETIYIMGKSVTAEDVRFAEQLYQKGIPVSFVRTRMDALKRSEEDVTITMAEERKTIHNIIPDAMVFFVSAEPDNEFFASIADLRNYMVYTLSEDISKHIEESVKSRGEVICRELCGILNEQLTNLKKRANNETMEYEDRIEAIEKKKKMLNNTLEVRRSKIDKGFKDAKAEANIALIRKKSGIVASFINYLDKKTPEGQYRSKTDNEAKKRLREAYVMMQSEYKKPFDRFMSTNTYEVMDKLSDDLIDLSDTPVPESIDDVICDGMENNKLLNDLYDIISNIEAEITKLENQKAQSPENGEYDSRYAELAEERRKLNEKKNELGQYIPKYVTDYSAVTGNKEKMQMIGKALDWLTLLIPGKAYEQAALKIGQWIAKAGKAAKAVGTVAKGADTVKDVAYALKHINIPKTYKTTKRAKAVMDTFQRVGDRVKKDVPGLLDLITFEFWLGKLGEKFDGEPIEREDLEYKNQYAKERSELERKYNAQLMRELELKEEHRLFKNRQDRVDYEIEQKKSNRNKIADEMRSKEAAIRKDAALSVYRKYADEYTKWFDGQIDKIADYVQTNMDKMIEPICEQYKESCTTDIIDELDLITERYNRTMNEFNEFGANELHERINKCESYLKELGDYNYA